MSSDFLIGIVFVLLLIAIYYVYKMEIPEEEEPDLQVDPWAYASPEIQPVIVAPTYDRWPPRRVIRYYARRLDDRPHWRRTFRRRWGRGRRH